MDPSYSLIHCSCDQAAYPLPSSMMTRHTSFGYGPRIAFHKEGARSITLPIITYLIYYISFFYFKTPSFLTKQLLPISIFFLIFITKGNSPSPDTYTMHSEFEKDSMAKKGGVYTFGICREAYDRVNSQ